MNNILSDLDDFLAPSLECIKMVPPPNKKISRPGGEHINMETNQTSAKVELTNDMEMENEIKVEMHMKQ